MFLATGEKFSHPSNGTHSKSFMNSMQKSHQSGLTTVNIGLTTAKKTQGSISDNPIYSMQEKYLRELGDNYESIQKNKKVQKFMMLKKIKLIQRVTRKWLLNRRIRAVAVI